MKENLVRDWMTPDPITIPSTCALPDAYWLMINHRIRRLPAVERENKRFSMVSMAAGILVAVIIVLSKG